MAGKWKKRLKKIGKIAAGAGILALAAKGFGKGKGKGAVTGVMKPGGFPKTDWIKKIVKPKITPPDMGNGMWDDPNWAAKKGGRATAKHGGRTRKQFGGGLPVARPIGGVGAGVGAGVRAPVRPLGYKKGGHVKSMGIAKRGGGVAKR